MIPLVFTLAAILIIAAAALSVVGHRRRSTSETAVALPSSSSLYDEPSDPTGKVIDVMVEDVVSEQPSSLGQGSSEAASVVRLNVAADTDSEIVVETGLAADVDSGTEVPTTKLGIPTVEEVPTEPEFVSGAEPGGPAEMPEAAEDTGASGTSEATANLSAEADVTLRSDTASGVGSSAELGEEPGTEPAESMTAEDTDTTDESKTDLASDAVITEANSPNAVDTRTEAVADTEFQATSGDNVETGEVPQSPDFAAHTQTTQETNAARPAELTQPV